MWSTYAASGFDKPAGPDLFLFLLRRVGVTLVCEKNLLNKFFRIFAIVHNCWVFNGISHISEMKSRRKADNLCIVVTVKSAITVPELTMFLLVLNLGCDSKVPAQKR